MNGIIISRIRKLLAAILKPRLIIGWIYAAYLTLRYVDSYVHFPAFVFKGHLIRVNINKGKGAQLTTRGRILIQPWIGTFSSEITISDKACLSIYSDFIIGDDVHIRLTRNAKCVIEGKKFSSGSGITARSIIMVERDVSIGTDVIIAWDTFITDSDWHTIGNTPRSSFVHIGNHVWVANGVKILKGTYIGDDCIVGCGSVLTGGDFPAKSLLGGIPAKIIKSNIPGWNR